MTTAKAMKTRAAKAAKKAPTPAELAWLIEVTVREHFPHCEDVSLILVPSPGVGPVEMRVRGEVMQAVGADWDDWFPVHWKPAAPDAD